MISSKIVNLDYNKNKTLDWDTKNGKLWYTSCMIQFLNNRKKNYTFFKIWTQDLQPPFLNFFTE